MPDQTTRFQCRHIFTDGHRCGSACLRHEEFCYYHHTTRRPIENPRRRRSRQAQFDLPLPEDRTAIQSSIGEVLRRIASNEIDSKRAGLLLYGLQIASINLPRPSRAAERSYNSRSRYRTLRDEEDTPETTLIEEIVLDPKLGPLAPRAEIAEKEEHLSVVGQLVRRFELERQQEEREKAEAAAKAEPDALAAPHPAAEPRAPQLAPSLPALEDACEPNPCQIGKIIPTIQACQVEKHVAKHRPTIPQPLAERITTRKSAEKLTHTARIAIVRGFREYPDRAYRETKGAEGWRKAQAN